MGAADLTEVQAVLRGEQRWAMVCGDALEVLAGMEAGSVDAVVTDPPYGIRATFGLVTRGGKNWRTKHHNRPIANDDKPFDPSPWLAFPECLMWGANYYADKLPPGGWLVWDKRHGVEDMQWNRSEAELAFRKGQTVVRVFRYLWHGLCRDGEIGVHLHPMQKPVALMRWCLEMVEGQVILDPYAGSGTTGVACLQTGRRFIGAEISPEYHAIAVDRLRRAESEVVNEARFFGQEAVGLFDAMKGDA